MQVARIAKQEQLGHLQAIYRPSLVPPIAIIFLVILLSSCPFLLLLLLLFTLLLLGFSAAVSLFLQMGALVWVLELLLLLGALLCFFVARQLVRQRQYAFYLYERGLIATGPGPLSVVRWEQVQSTHFRQRFLDVGLASTLAPGYTMQQENGALLSIEREISHYEELIRRIESATLPTRLARARERYQAAGAVSLGDLTLSESGISRQDDHRSTPLPWQEIRSLQLRESDDTLIIHRQDDRRPWYSKNTADARVLYTLAREIWASHRQAPPRRRRRQASSQSAVLTGSSGGTKIEDVRPGRRSRKRSSRACQRSKALLKVSSFITRRTTIPLPAFAPTTARGHCASAMSC
jgi:hypothetical protein